jgi:flavin reductase (DIM6/NTAB) family NADH-FMN oxidoreductase RutF
VLNLAGEDLHEAVECIAPTTGCEHVPVWKQASGYRHEADKFALAAFTRGRRAAHRRMPAATGSALQLAIERPLAAWRDFAGGYVVAELEVVRVHAHPEVTIAETHHVDPRRYYPLFYVFRHYAGRGAIRGCTLKAEV